MDVFIVKLDSDVIDDLYIEGDSDALGTALWPPQQAVVVAAATAQSFTVTRKGKTGNENDVERGDADGRALRLRLPDVHLAATKIFHAPDMPCLKSLMFDLEETSADSLCVKGRQQIGHEIRLIFQSAKKSDSGTLMPRRGTTPEVRGDVHTGGIARGFIHGTQPFAHDLTQRGFVVHGVRS